MEFARRRRRRRRNGIRTMTVLLMLGLAVYLITASAAGKWLSEKVMAPAFSALSELPLFTGGGLDSLENEASEPSGDALSVSLSSGGSSLPRFEALCRIPRQAFGLKQYFSGAFAIKICDKEDAFSSLGYSPVLRVKHSPGD